MVDGIAGTDLMQLIFDLDPDAEHEAPQPWTPQREPSTLEVLAARSRGRRRATRRSTWSDWCRELEKLDARSAPRMLLDYASVDVAHGALAWPRQAVTADGPLAQRADRPAPALGVGGDVDR